jgi:hypothetical protein
MLDPDQEETVGVRWSVARMNDAGQGAASGAEAAVGAGGSASSGRSRKSPGLWEPKWDLKSMRGMGGSGEDRGQRTKDRRQRNALG